jgi:myo-inositol 2-dehydrogenase / D-chiro-inositol 1-dehydrogenase
LEQIRALAQRSINYDDEDLPYDTPIIDAAYVTLPFLNNRSGDIKIPKSSTLGCLELCMYAEGSRHQEEIIVTGTKGRLEAYLPENKVYAFQRPTSELWSNRSEPPPPSSIRQHVYDCSDVKQVHGITGATMPTHGGYHYSSTAVEWFKVVVAIRNYEETGVWKPLVSLEDGIRAVEMGLQATRSTVNEEVAAAGAAPATPATHSQHSVDVGSGQNEPIFEIRTTNNLVA